MQDDTMMVANGITRVLDSATEAGAGAVVMTGLQIATAHALLKCVMVSADENMTPLELYIAQLREIAELYYRPSGATLQ